MAKYLKSLITNFMACACLVLGLSQLAHANDYNKLFKQSTWSKLSTKDKIEMLGNEELQVDYLRYNQIKDPAFQKAINEMSKLVLEEVDRDQIGASLDALESIFAIGEPQPVFVHVHSAKDGPVAISLGLYMDGGATEDGSIPPKKHYATKEEAKAAGLDIDADVNWQVQSYFEWDGKNWKVLKIDTVDEGGFTWGGW